MIIRYYQAWKTFKLPKFILISVLWSFLLGFPLALLIFEAFGVVDEEVGSAGLENSGIVSAFFAAVIVAPILETFICQTIPIVVVQKFNIGLQRIMALTLSTLIFASIHLGYSIWYAILIFPSGLILAEAYLIFQNRKEPSFWVVTAIHALRKT